MPHAMQIRRTGGPEVLNWTPIEVGEPGSGQVRLRQAAAGLNYIDVYHRTGYYSQPLPFIPRLEGAGTVEAIGQDVRDLKVGDRVAYAGPAGGYSEVRLIEADRPVRLPDAISFDQAAAMMLQGMTVQVLIRQVYPVKAGDLILVHAAAGVTGLILCQWAAALGATVIGIVSTEAKAELAHAHGCKHTILYSKKNFVAEVSRISGGEKLPVVFDSVAKDTFLRSLDCLRSRGLMVTFGQASGPIDPIAPVLLSQKGSLFLTRPFLFHYIERREELEASTNPQGLGSARHLRLRRPDRRTHCPQELSMSKTTITSPELAPPVGPFSQAVEAGGFIYFSGQVGQDPTTGKLVAGGMAAETQRVFQNLAAVLKAAGKSFDDVVRVGVFLTSMSDFVALNGVYAKHFRQPFPARTTVAVAALPLGACVEMDLVVKA
jgi:NADPH2:quinone reductase